MSDNYDCDCSPESGPCEEHGRILFQREGAALRTAEELAIQYIDDALTIDSEILAPYGREVVRQARAAGRDVFLLDGLADELFDVEYQVENNLAGVHRNGYNIMTVREDGYTIYDVHSGPLRED